ncbi:MAG TPA: hypothetical protein VLH94_04600 [Spirochaetia bacterium]|nr:hypothetical protein [Spirochaetia bacterium]
MATPIFKQLDPPLPFISSTHLISVDYDKSVEEMINEGGYYWKNDNITSDNFPSSEKGIIQKEIFLVGFNRVVVSVEDVLKGLERLGLCSINLKELLSLGTQYPEIQNKDWIVALGSTWCDSYGHILVPNLDNGGGHRRLDLFWWENYWVSRWRFAAVCN